MESKQKLTEKEEYELICLVCGEKSKSTDTGAKPTTLTRRTALCGFGCEMVFYSKNPINLEIRTGFSLITGINRQYNHPEYYNFRSGQAEIIFSWSGNNDFLSVSVIKPSRQANNCYSKQKPDWKD